MAELTPMMRQYMEIKEQNKDAILMYRLGDFYEMFFEDAETAARELDLVLTGRECGLEERAPMAGVPFRTVNQYVARLIAKGYRVAICEQLEDPKSAPKGALVRRGVTRLVTPGTVIDEDMVPEHDNTYIMAVEPDGEFYGISWCDVSTGEFNFRDFLTAAELKSEAERLSAREFLVPESLRARMGTQEEGGPLISPYPDTAFGREQARKTLEEHFHVNSLKCFGIELVTAGVRAAGALMQYLHDSQKNSLEHITKLQAVQRSSFLLLDAAAVRNLELVQTLITAGRKGSLLGVLDKTRTSGGARLLKRSILEPLRNREAIERRQSAVQALLSDPSGRDTVCACLDEIRDPERILSRLSYGTASLKDCISLRRSLQVLPVLRKTLHEMDDPLLSVLADSMEELPEICRMLERALPEDAAGVQASGEGIIRAGYSPELDELIALAEDSTQRLAGMEAAEKEKTGIKTLRIRYNKVFGYYIEVSKAYLALVPEYYVRRQTMANGERYVTEELKALEETILTASEKRRELEATLFQDIQKQLEAKIRPIQQTAAALSMLDMLQSLARVAYENSYVRPEITDGSEIDIVGGRHPVVEGTSREGFVPNDTHIGSDEEKMLLITGPNMAGKSTFMRQVGLIVLMAHMGSFVPAAKAGICLVDRIFTRIGASDDLASGQSTFMVEMNELASILNNATPKSLLILDEVGRGTSTSDGLAIAHAAAVHILTKIGAKTLFATHFHELQELGDEYEGIKNCSMAIKEIGRDIVFLHRIVDGGTDRSFGIEVARLAGVPEDVVRAARSYVASYRSPERNAQPQAGSPAVRPVLETLEAVRSVNPDTLAPLEALNLIYRLRQEMDEKEPGLS